jgi:hypothetical protein
MSTTVERRPRLTRRADPDPRTTEQTKPAGQPVPGPPKARRRWGLVAAAVVVVALGAVGNVWLLQSSTDAEQVVAARTAIERGQVITAEQLMNVSVSADPAVRTVPAPELSSLVGQRAAVDVAAGALLTADSTTAKNVPGEGVSLVGVALSPAMMPGPPLVAGDRIRVVATLGQQQDPTLLADPAALDAVVVSVQAGLDSVGQGQTILTVEVPEGDAAGLAAMAATGRVAVVLDSRDR